MTYEFLIPYLSVCLSVSLVKGWETRTATVWLTVDCSLSYLSSVLMNCSVYLVNCWTDHVALPGRYHISENFCVAGDFFVLNFCVKIFLWCGVIQENVFST